MATVSSSFTAVGNGTPLLVKHGDSLSYAVTNTFVGTWILQKSQNNFTSFEEVARGTATVASTLHECNTQDRKAAQFRFRCEAFTSGTVDTAMVEGAALVTPAQQFKDPKGVVVLECVEGGVKVSGTLQSTGAVQLDSTVVRTAQKRIFQAAGLAKVGSVAGWVLSAADNVSLVTLPASQTGSKLVMRIPNLKVGDTITSFHLIGQIESGGNTVTVDADLRKQTAAAADVVDASIGAITQLSVVADTIMSSANTAKTLATAEVVGEDETFYLVLTATTGAATDIALMGVAVVVNEA